MRNLYKKLTLFGLGCFIISNMVAQTVSIVADINPGTVNSNPSDLAVYNNKLYFNAFNLTVGYELMVYDGTTVSVAANIFPGTGNSTPLGLAVYNNKLYFGAFDPTIGHELMVYDGTTVSVAVDINPGTGNSYPKSLAVYNDKLYFIAFDTGYEYELMVYDGSTVSVPIDILPGITYSTPSNLAVYNNKLYFGAYDPTVGYELMVYDGTTASIAADIVPGPDNLFTGSSNPSSLAVYNNKLYFGALDPAVGNELMVYEDTSLGIVENSFDDQFIIYPNPTNGQIFIEFENIHKKLSIKLISVTGQLIESNTKSNTNRVELIIKNPSGIYFLEISDMNGKKANLKIIKN